MGAKERAEYLKKKSREAAAQVNTYVDQGKDQLNDYVEKGKQAVTQGRAQVQDYVERGRATVAKHASKVSAAVDAGKQAYHRNHHHRRPRLRRFHDYSALSTSTGLFQGGKSPVEGNYAAAIVKLLTVFKQPGRRGIRTPRFRVHVG